ncbi:hypothetical protein K438DRAFT_1752601 [Mycena galopus ATCC 62051]|nr:hypothetical protein K438DRAFT_1752601 [Mycena galopus ATCC 62051]
MLPMDPDYRWESRSMKSETIRSGTSRSAWFPSAALALQLSQKVRQRASELGSKQGNIRVSKLGCPQQGKILHGKPTGGVIDFLRRDHGRRRKREREKWHHHFFGIGLEENLEILRLAILLEKRQPDAPSHAKLLQKRLVFEFVFSCAVRRISRLALIVPQFFIIGRSARSLITGLPALDGGCLLSFFAFGVHPRLQLGYNYISVASSLAPPASCRDTPCAVWTASTSSLSDILIGLPSPNLAPSRRAATTCAQCAARDLRSPRKITSPPPLRRRPTESLSAIARGRTSLCSTLGRPPRCCSLVIPLELPSPLHTECCLTSAWRRTMKATGWEERVPPSKSPLTPVAVRSDASSLASAAHMGEGGRAKALIGICLRRGGRTRRRSCASASRIKSSPLCAARGVGARERSVDVRREGRGRGTRARAGWWEGPLRLGVSHRQRVCVHERDAMSGEDPLVRRATARSVSSTPTRYTAMCFAELTLRGMQLLKLFPRRGLCGSVELCRPHVEQDALEVPLRETERGAGRPCSQAGGEVVSTAPLTFDNEFLS